MQNKIKLATCAVIAVLTGCQEQVDLTPWWSEPLYSGHFPLEADHHPIFIYEKQAFIDAKSVIRDCNGNAIKNGNQMMFLVAHENIAFFDPEEGSVSSVHPLAKFANVAPNLHNIQPTETITVNLALAGDLKSEASQCSEEAEHTASAVYWE